MGRLEKIIDRLNEALYENRNKGEEEEIYSAYATIRVGRKTIYMSVSDKVGDVCEIIDDEYTGRYYENIENFLYSHITPFNKIKENPKEDIWQRNGFRDKNDFITYKYG